MAQIIQELNKLRLDLLDDAWVQGIYYSEFLEFGEFPADYESVLEEVNVRSVFRGIMRAISDWLSERSEEEKSWATLSHQVPHQKLLTILAYYIDLGTKNILNKEYRNNALLVARLYYKLLSIPGYKAYHIYHSQLFTHSLECLSFPKEMCNNEKNYYNIKELTCEVNTVIRELRMFVTDLKTIIKTLQLTPSDMNFEDILSNLVDITGGAIVNKFDADKIELANVSRVIYDIIDLLLSDSSGDSNGVAIRLLFKCILPKLIEASADSRNANNFIRASYVTYTGFLLTKYGKIALSGFVVLLQHLCYTPDGLERAEVRQARVSLVVGLMSLLPQKSYRNFMKWILKLSTTAKIAHRQIALELLAKLLSNDPEDEPPQEYSEQPTEGEGANKSAADQSNSENLDDKKEGKCDATPTENKTCSSPTDALTTEDESSQDSQEPLEQEVTEEEVAGLLRQRAHTAPYARILRAVFERVNDVSSTLRTRALAVLQDCLQSERPAMKQAVQELNGTGQVSRLMAVAARCVCDERAAVRKAALSLALRSLSQPGAPPPQPTDLAILVSLCRDASIIVRSGAVAALGELAARRPCDAVFDAFLSGPLHQLSDPEAKIQEQVGQLVQQLLMDRVKQYSAAEAEEPAPWLLLAGVARHSMRRHLQKACALLAKAGGGVNHRLVDIVSTHLSAKDEARDLQCLVLLTSAARHLDYGDLGFVLDYYYKLTDDTRTHDARLISLTVELLSSWSRFIGTEERTALRDHIVRRLAAGIDDGCRISSASLAAQLDPHNLNWATELMQLSERRALSGTDVEEWVRAADLSLLAPAPPSPALLPLFLGALAAPPPEWSAAERGACVAGCGRLCVRARAAAAAAAPPLAALLRDAAAPVAVRHNALLALTDICVRYTCIVEPQLGALRGCVARDAPPALRRAAARALTRLLLAGFLRLRTPLYYTYCALLADEEPAVREPAEYYVTRCLPPDAIYHHFVDCVMHYNSGDGTEESISFDERQLIYDVMLQRLSIVQRLNLQCRLAREVLAHAADTTDEGDGELSPALNAALLDAITLLCGPRMKLPRKPQRDGEADIDDLQERITTNIVSHKMKSTVAEVVVPAVLRLYARLGARGGQRAAYLVRIATDLLADYRHEIEELIENDEELVEKVRQFQETIGIEPSFGNARNLVTASSAHEPDTPRAPRRRPRAARAPRSPPRKRALRI